MTGPPVYSREQIASLIANDALDVHFQAIVDLHDGVVVAYEALSRPAMSTGLTDVCEVFHSAESHGLIWELEEITRRTAIVASSDWPRGTKLFLNSTPAVFADPRFLDSLESSLKRVPDLTPDRLVLEITELSENQEHADLAEQVRRVVSAGYQVALDDAGAGSSGLNRMMAMRPQWVKLDREFVRGIDRDNLRQNLVRFFVHYARLSGVQVLAEGIESATELETVTSLGVRFAQGYYLGRPSTRMQAMDPRFISDLRTRWAAVEASLPRESTEPTLISISRPCDVCDADTPMEVASTRIANTPEAAGIIVVAGAKVIGWTSRRGLESESSHRNESVRMHLDEGVLALDGKTTLRECICEVVRFESETLSDPIIVMNGSRPVGIVRLRDVLRVVGTDGQLASAGRASLTGLPDRKRADEHIADHIRQWKVSAPDAHKRHSDASFVDIRAFNDFNSRHGRPRGDQLIRDLAELISMVVVSAEPDAFLSHLGDDRFLVTAPAGRLEPRLRTLMQIFDTQSLPADGVEQPTLRVLTIYNALRCLESCRDLYRIEQQLREQARDRESLPPTRIPTSAMLTHDSAVASRIRRAA